MITILDLTPFEDNINNTIQSLIKVEQKREYLRSSLNKFLSVYETCRQEYDTDSLEITKIKDIIGCLNKYDLSSQRQFLISSADELNKRIYQNTPNEVVMEFLYNTSFCFSDILEKAEQMSAIHKDFRSFAEANPHRALNESNLLRNFDIFRYTLVSFKCNCRQNIDDIRILIEYFSAPTESPPNF